MIIGLTGGIASGKSTVSNYLQDLGAVIIDADKIARTVLEKGEQAYKEVVDFFGKDILKENAEIDRSKLGKLIFSEKKYRNKLEEITHPVIIKKINKKIEEYRENNRIIILDAPLLFEVGLDKDVDQTWLVYVDKETQINRLMSRDNISKDEAIKRIEAQLPIEKKKEMADIVIDNRKGRENLKTEVLKHWRDTNEN
ncbi:MAG: dephospho-CoA kinase [Bacillota bacterium]